MAENARCTPDCGPGHPDTGEADYQRMMPALYSAGFGYHAIADLCGRTHAEIRHLLLANFPAVPERPHWDGHRGV